MADNATNILADNLEDNDSFSTATDLTQFGEDFYFSDLSIHSDSDVDYFSFSLSTQAPSYYTISLSSDWDNDLDLFLYDASGNQLALSDDDGTDEIIYLDGLNPGTYVIGVEGFEGSTGLYDLSMNDNLAPKSDGIDFSGDGVVNHTDALVMMRYLFGTFPGDSLVADISNLTNSYNLHQNIASVVAQKEQSGAQDLLMDIDGNGSIEALTDGLAITHYIHHSETSGGSPWTPPDFIQADRSTTELQQHLKDLAGF